MNFDTTFWLLISFIVFCIAGFKKVKSLIKNGIEKYSQTVNESIENAENGRNESDSELASLKNKTTEIEETCKKIKNAAVFEIERLEKEMKNKISSYLSFKERYMEEKITIYSREKTSQIKKQVLNASIEVLTKYLQDKKTTNQMNQAVILQILENNFTKTNEQPHQ
jgi:F0F1-type ATP synthase membrane subunit b/b'